MGEAKDRSFGELLRRHRRAGGWSQEALAQRADLSIDAIASLERGRRSAPHADTLRRLVEALGLADDERQTFLMAAEPASPAARRPAPPDYTSNGSTIPRNLPLALSSFVGRTETLATLRRQLARPAPPTRLVTLVGPGGIGKTRLALETARSLADNPPPDAASELFSDGVWLAELSALDDPAAVPTVVAAALQATRQPVPSGVAALTRWLADRRLLLVLDNCEHLIDACAGLVDALLRGCRHVVILATSREALAIPGEVVCPLGPLTDVETGALFVERAAAVRPDFEPTPANSAAVVELCRQLDGIPLAIELAAARINAFDVQTLAARLSDRFVLLNGGNRVAPPRHQTLQALVRWSYDLLSPDEQRLFARLAVFAGGWDLEAVEAIAADDQPQATPTIELLGRLVDKSLVTRAADQFGRTRYVLLETLRQFAAQPLTASGELAGLQRRHAAYYLALIEQVEPQIEGPRQAEYLQRLEQDIDNLRAALDWCAAADEVEPALRGAWCLALLAWLRGYLEEVDGRLTVLLDRPSALALPPHVRARALVAHGYVAFYRGQLARAHGLVERGLTVFRELQRAQDVGQALVWLGLIVDAEEDVERAGGYLGEALQIFRDSGDAFWTARAATNLGRSLGGLGDLNGAIPLLEEALRLRRRLGDRRGVANTLHHLADALEGSGRLLEARSLADEALSIAQAVGDRFVTVRAWIGLGRVAYALGDPILAANHLEQAMAVARLDGFGHEQAEIAVLLGQIALDSGDLVRARQVANEGLRLALEHARRVEADRARLLLDSIAQRGADLPDPAAG